MCGMRYSTFSLYNVAGGTVWGVIFVLVGYFAAASWRQFHRIAGMTSLALVAAAVLIFVALRVSRARREELQLPQMAKTVAERRHWSLFGLLGLLCGAIFLSLALHALRHPDGGGLDGEFLRLVLSHRIGWVAEAMKVVSGLGSSIVLLPAIIVAGHEFLVRRGDWRPAVALLASWLGSVLLYTSLKNLVERPPPPAVYSLVKLPDSSFPSAHATQAIAVLGAMAWILSRGRAPPGRFALLASCALVSLLVGAARVYLGAHWLTDVLAGYVLGGIWLFGVMMWFPDRAKATG
jgi:undecaprenyl-diphosphatase